MNSSLDVNKMRLHVGHDMEIVTYGGSRVGSYVLECQECNEVLADADVISKGARVVFENGFLEGTVVALHGASYMNPEDGSWASVDWDDGFRSMNLHSELRPVKPAGEG